MAAPPAARPPIGPALLAALVSALLLALTLPDAGLWPLGFVALAPLVAVLPGLGWRRALLAGWVAGAVANAAIFHWIVHTAITMSDFPFVAAAGVLLAYAAWSGLAYGVFAALASPLAGRPAAVATVPAALVAVELCWPHLFPWHLGNVYFRVPLLMQGMDLTGVYGASFVSAAVAVAVAAAGRALLPRPDPAAVRRALLHAVLPAALLLAAWLGYGAVREASVREASAGRRVRLALVQPDITASDKKQKDIPHRKTLYARLTELTRTGDLEGVDAVVWPEGAFPFYFATDPGTHTNWTNIVETSKRLVAWVRETGRPLVFGTLTEPAGRARNTVVMLGADGVERGRYDKRRLLAFGEYMPFSDVLPFLKGKVKEVADMQAGETPVALPIGTATALVSICYEAILPTFTRQAANDVGADLLLNLTNDAWFGTSGAPAQHLMVQAPRAVELRVPLVRVTETGITAVLSPAGDFLLETGCHERRVDTLDVPLADGVTSPYREVGDVFGWGCVGGLAIALFARHRSGKKSRSTSTG